MTGGPFYFLSNWPGGGGSSGWFVSSSRSAASRSQLWAILRRCSRFSRSVIRLASFMHSWACFRYSSAVLMVAPLTRRDQPSQPLILSLVASHSGGAADPFIPSRPLPSPACCGAFCWPLAWPPCLPSPRLAAGERCSVVFACALGAAKLIFLMAHPFPGRILVDGGPYPSLSISQSNLAPLASRPTGRGNATV